MGDFSALISKFIKYDSLLKNRKMDYGLYAHFNVEKGAIIGSKDNVTQLDNQHALDVTDRGFKIFNGED